MAKKYFFLLVKHLLFLAFEYFCYFVSWSICCFFVLKFLGRKRKKSKTSNYIISCDPTDLSRQADGFVGKLRSNIFGTTFFVYDNGSKIKTNDLRQDMAVIIYVSASHLMRFLFLWFICKAFINYLHILQDTNILGFKGPRNMTVLLPGMTEDDQRVKVSSCDTTQQGLLDSWKTKVRRFYPFVFVYFTAIEYMLVNIRFLNPPTEYGQCRWTA